MSKIYNKYLELKENDSEKLYLFPCGNFYIFLADDAYKINDYVVLKTTYFAKDVVKCGFPKASMDSYLKIFHHHNLDVFLVEDTSLSSSNNRLESIITILQKTNLEQIPPIEAINLLAKLKEISNGKKGIN